MTSSKAHRNSRGKENGEIGCPYVSELNKAHDIIRYLRGVKESLFKIHSSNNAVRSLFYKFRFLHFIFLQLLSAFYRLGRYSMLISHKMNAQLSLNQICEQITQPSCVFIIFSFLCSSAEFLAWMMSLCKSLNFWSVYLTLCKYWMTL